MGRKRKSKIYNYFDYDEQNNKSKCLVNECGQLIKGHHGSNLLRHVLSRHRDQYNEIKGEDQENQQNNSTKSEAKLSPILSNEIKEIENQENQQNGLGSEMKFSLILSNEIKEIEYQENQQNSSRISEAKFSPILSQVIQNCINLITVHGRPFSLLQDEAFVKLIKLIPEMTDGIPRAMSPNYIKSRIEEQAYEIRQQICEEVKNKLISLKIDVVSVRSRKFVGVNLQYIKDASLVLRNLRVLELHERNSADFLKETIMTVLSKLGIEIKQLYSIISDNGANMLAISRQITELQGELDETAEDEASDSDDNIEFTSKMYHTNHQKIVDSLDEIVFEENYQNETLSRIKCMRCAAHILQLAVKDASLDIEPLLDQCRQLVRTLRKPNVALELRQNNLNQAVLDCPTRWDSTVTMLERLMQVKEFCVSNSTRFAINDINIWTRIEESLQALKPCSVLSKILQREQLALGDFLISWVKCKLKLENINTTMSLFLVICMTEREQDLFENDVFLSAIYLDPRVNSMLSEEQCLKARQHLISTYLRYIALINPTQHTLQEQSQLQEDVKFSPSTSATSTDNQYVPSNILQSSKSVNSAIEDDPSSYTLNIEVDEYLQQNYLERQREAQTNMRLELDISLKKFLDEALLPSKANILEFWEKRKLTDPQLYFLSNITLATPSTQVSIERLFSSLKYVHNNLRMSFKDSVIEDVMLVRNNALYIN